MIESKLKKRKTGIKQSGDSVRFVSTLSADNEGTDHIRRQRSTSQSITAEYSEIKELVSPFIIPLIEKINSLQMELQSVNKELSEIKEREKYKNLQKLKNQSDKNVKKIRKLFNLPEIKSTDEYVDFSELKGAFNDLSDNEDSVTFLNTIRDEEN